MASAIRASSHTVLETRLPFLYQTPTILRRNYASDAFGEIGNLHLKRVARDQIAANWSKVNRSPTRTPRKKSSPSREDARQIDPRRSRGTSTSSSSRRGTSYNDRTTSRRASSPRSTSEPQPREWIDHIPFEGVDSRPATILDRLAGQTMTRHEFNIFKTVLAQGANAETALREASAARRVDSTGRSKGVIREEAEFPDLLRPLAEEASTITAERAKEAEEVLKEKADIARFREKMEKAMDSAGTDVELWQLLEASIFPAVKVALVKKDGELGITTTIPSLLIYMSNLLHTRFRGSRLALALLPTLKKLGPAAFAMGATTELYNTHMRVLLERYADLDGIAACLAEMDRDVYEFDQGTMEILEECFRRAEKDGGFWGTERKVRALEVLEGWEKVVGERIGRREARRADLARAKTGEEEEVGLSVEGHFSEYSTPLRKKM